MKRYISYLMAIAVLAGSCKNNSTKNVENQDVPQDGICHYDGSEEYADEEQDTFTGGHVSVSEDGALSVESAMHPNGKTLRYASWKKPKTMADAPDIVINGGERRQFPCAPDEYHRDDEFSFVKDGYEYIVNYNEVIPNKEGFGATSHIYLLVKKGGKTIVKQEKEEQF